MRDHPAVAVRWHARDDFPIPPEGVGAQKVALRYTAEGSDLKNDMITIMRFNNDLRLLIMSVGIYLATSSGEMRLTSGDPSEQHKQVRRADRPCAQHDLVSVDIEDLVPAFHLDADSAVALEQDFPGHAVSSNC